MEGCQMVASVVIPNWNGKELLKVALSSLKTQTIKDHEVIVVDNGSIDGSVEFIKNNHPEVRLVQLEKNIGFAPAVNLGIKAAKGEYIVLINNDTKVDKDCLKYLIQAAKDHQDVGMVAAKMLQFYNPHLVDSAGDYLDSVGHADNIGRGEKSERYNKPGYIFLTTGGGSLIKREVFDKVGLFDDDYFAYFEDVDLCLRAQMLGYKAWFEPKAVIYHVHKATSNKNKSFTEYLQFRNMTMTIIKDFPNGLILHKNNLLKIILVNLNTVFYLARVGYFSSAIKAEWYILKHLGSLLKKRHEIQSKKIIDDRYFISNVNEKKIKIPILNIRF